MSRLIDADKLRKDIQFVLDTLGEPTNHGLRQAMSIIDNTPTVEADVVRCKDCVYAKLYNQIWQLPIHDGLVCTNFGNEEVDENFFCGCAIKKMDEVERVRRDG